MAVEGDHDWLSDIDLDPNGAWLRMGTRNLGSRPWLVADGVRQLELQLKDQLLAERFDEVFAIEAGSEVGAETAGRETLALVTEALASVALLSSLDAVRSDTVHPLDLAGRIVQEDLCLLRPGPNGGWVLAAATLCFPSRWRLGTKIGRGLAGIHSPVDGYTPVLNSRVDSLMTRLATSGSPGVVWRRNWFVHPDDALFQPDRPTADPVVSAELCLEQLVIRSERQTVRALPESGWTLFAIRTQQAPLSCLVADSDRRELLLQYLSEADQALVSHRGVCVEQRRLLLEALEESI